MQNARKSNNVFESRSRLLLLLFRTEMNNRKVYKCPPTRMDSILTVPIKVFACWSSAVAKKKISLGEGGTSILLLFTIFWMVKYTTYLILFLSIHYYTRKWEIALGRTFSPGHLLRGRRSSVDIYTHSLNFGYHFSGFRKVFYTKTISPVENFVGDFSQHFG